MPTNHIPDKIWRMVEKEHVKAVTKTQRPFKESEIIEILLRKGISAIEVEDYERAKKVSS